MRNLIRAALAGTASLALAACAVPEERPTIDGPLATRGMGPAQSPWAEANPNWVAPVAPFRIAGPLHYVGTRGLGIFLVETPEGHILIDGGLPGYEDIILTNIRALGLDPSDVRVLLNTHAHFDHSGGLARLKEVTGAELYAMGADVPALEGGYYAGAEDEAKYGAPPVEVDRTLVDGDEVSVGGVALTALQMPGHSPGCTSWTLDVGDGENTEEVLIFCSATVAGNSLVPEQYPGIVADYRRTFDKARDWSPDIFVANHPSFSNLFAQRKSELAGTRNAYRDYGRFRRMMNTLERQFEERLAEEQAAAAGE